MKAVKARKDRVVGASVQSLTDWLGGLKTLEYIQESASFASPSTVRAGKRVLTAPQIFINAGASAHLPDWPGLSPAAR